MDVPLVLNDIEIRQGLMRFKRKSSTFSHLADVGDFLCFALIFFEKLKNVIDGYFWERVDIKDKK